MAGEITGRLNAGYSEVEYYFKLKNENELLATQNEALLSRLPQSFVSADTALTVVTDSTISDTANRKFYYRTAKVVNNSVIFPNNYLTIHRGSNQGVKVDMGVIGPNGIVGSVVNTSENFSVVMSLLHRQTSVSVKLKNSGEIGRVFWDGTDPDYVKMINVPRTAVIQEGDSVVTSGFSLKYPEGVLVGTVVEIQDEDKASSFLQLKLKTGTNFYNVNHVFVVENFQREEQQKLEEAARMIHE